MNHFKCKKKLQEILCNFWIFFAILLDFLCRFVSSSMTKKPKIMGITNSPKKLGSVYHI